MKSSFRLLRSQVGRQGVRMDTTVVAFDVHGVLFRFHYKKLALILSLFVVGLVSSAYVSGLRRLWPLVFLPVLFWTALGIWYFSHEKWYGYAPAVERYLQGNGWIKRVLRRNWLFFANLFVPHRKTFELAWELKERGFKVIVASNIGKFAWQELRETYATYFERKGQTLFDDYFHLNGRQWWTNPADGLRFDQGWLTKTHKDYFVGLHAFVRAQVLSTCEQIILVDNNHKVISRAWGEEAERFRLSVLFRDPDDARKSLAKFGVL